MPCSFTDINFSTSFITITTATVITIPIIITTSIINTTNTKYADPHLITTFAYSHITDASLHVIPTYTDTFTITTKTNIPSIT
jgi:hypothetical protein